MVCLIGGCSETNYTTTQKDLELRSDEPFMAAIKEIATEREDFYFLGQTIDKAEYDRRESELHYQRDRGYLASEPKESFEVIPIVMIRF